MFCWKESTINCSHKLYLSKQPQHKKFLNPKEITFWTQIIIIKEYWEQMNKQCKISGRILKFNHLFLHLSQHLSLTEFNRFIGNGRSNLIALTTYIRNWLEEKFNTAIVETIISILKWDTLWCLKFKSSKKI